MGKLDQMGGRWTQDACSRCVLKMRVQFSPAGEFCLFQGGPFSSFWAIFAGLGQFWSIFGVHFSFFHFFSIFRYGILAPRTRPCTIGHRKTVLRYNVCPRLDPEKSLSDEVLAENGQKLAAKSLVTPPDQRSTATDW
jgi:hypothetical protein